MAGSFRDLTVWQRSIQTSIALYKLTAGFPPDERLGLTNQLRRAGVSIASNIAEGMVAIPLESTNNSLGLLAVSCSEVETQLVITRELGFGEVRLLDTAEALNVEVGKMLRGLINSL
jgi:four helix bundle protein